ncbi:MAG: SPOR domain-containing protein [Prolixibacteraceae bacterium]|nr:SPOR domain-containing protein [Prolixibacteraceae bacterium]
MKFGKYIHDLLLSNETVIIPGFGAFISEYQPAVITETEVKPPAKKIIFTTSIRNNDGLLVDFVAIEKQVSHFDALKIIEKERDNIVFLLDKGEEVILDAVGKLSMNDTNDIEFVPFHDENFSVEAFGFETVSLEELEKIQAEPEKETIATSEESVIEKNEGEVDNESNYLEEPKDANEISSVGDEIEPENESQYEDTEKSEPEVREEEAVIEPIADPIFATIKKAEPEEKNRKKTGWYWYLLILIPIIIAGVFVIKNTINKAPVNEKSHDIVINQTNGDETLAEENPVIVADTVESVQQESVSTDSLKIQSDEATAADDNVVLDHPIFYLVGGSFELEENALTYMKELIDKGFEPFLIGKRGKFYMIGVGKYQTEGQAVRARAEMWKTNPNAGLWIMEE